MFPSKISTQFLLFHLLLPLLLLFVSYPTAAYRYEICSEDAGNFTNNSTYQSNLNLLLSSLLSNGSSSGFFTDTVGAKTPNQVDGLVLCRGDINATACRSCLSNATVDILQLCAHNKDAVVWYDECLLHYSNASFLDTFDNAPSITLFNVYDVYEADRDRFNKVLNQLLNRTVDWAAYNSTKRFATGQAYNVNLTPTFTDLYAVAQCTPDMPASECRQCLQGMSHELIMGKLGCRSQGVRCNIRYEVSPFYLGDPTIRLILPVKNATAPAPAPILQPSVAPAGKGGRKKNMTAIILAIMVPAVTLISIIYICYRKMRKPIIKSPYETDPSVESLRFSLSMLRVATTNFSEENKLGEGGFGAVYKGLLPNGREIAVKRLLNSGQGLGELKNELVLVAKLQHRNLVKLLGVCLEEEKMIVYEYVPNRSLDAFLFDTARGEQLLWGTRYNIISGIARGLLYLHEESRLKIIHRDLKASNILLDADMKPKISDFGLAKLFDGDQTQGNTKRVVGTFGYMAPEYVMHGKFSIKSDVFSFGVLVLEILTGRRNSGSYNSENAEDLLSYTWENWNGGTALEIVDPALGSHYQGSDVLRCIQIGLLCVQENPCDRPIMSTVVMMLNSETVTLQAPSPPGFYVGMSSTSSNNPSFQVGMHDREGNLLLMSTNEVSISELEPR